jgi:predicted nucleotidyltransferase
MYLDKNSLIFGYPANEIRDVFRELGHDYAHEPFFCHHLGIKKAQASQLIINLIKDGYLERGKFCGNKDYVSLTIKGYSLRMASFAPPIARKTADRKIAELIERAKIVNTSNEFLYKVKRIAVFGSYLTDKDRINDIDIDIILKAKFSEKKQNKKENELREQAIRNGKVFHNYIDRLFYPITYTKDFLRHRSRAFSIHYEDQILEQTEYKIIYELKE